MCIFQVDTPVSESTRSTRSLQIQNAETVIESEDETDSSIISAPSYSMITVVDDNTDSLLGDEQSDVMATEQDTEEEETAVSLEDETAVVRDFQL